MLETYCLEGVLVSAFLFCLLYIFSFRNKLQSTRQVPVIIHIIILLFCVFAFWDTDYYGYINAIELIDPDIPFENQRTHLEQLYFWIIMFVNQNYTLFRVCIWGVAYVLFLKTLKNICVNNNETIALFIVYFLLIFSYSRVSLGMASLFYGISLIPKIHKNGIIKKACLLVAMLILSYYAHKSTVIAIAILPFIIFRLNKYTILFAIGGAVFIALYSGNEIISNLLYLDISDNEYAELIQTSANNYFAENMGSESIATTLLRILQIVSLILPVAYCFTNKNVYKYVSLNFTVRCFANYSLFLLLIGIVFGIVISFNSPMSYRILYISYIPNIIIISILLKEKLISNNIYNRFFALISIYSIFRILYTLYCLLI